MAHGIETGDKTYKRLRRDDEKWLLEDLHAMKRTVRKYIATLQPPNENETDASVQKGHKKMMTLDRILAIIVLGLFGSITFLAGLYLIIKGNYLVGVPGLVF